jgi:hypothetical protein
LIRLDGLAKDLSGTDKVLLADEFRERLGPHPVGKGPRSSKRLLPLLLKKVRLLFQYFPDSGLTALGMAGVGPNSQLTLQS